MDQLAEKGELEAGRRSVRRRLVQSTLFPQKSPEQECDGGDQNADKECEVEGDNEDDQEFCCGSQGKKIRKRKGKATPPATKASKMMKEKSPKNSTPKKNGKSPKNTTPKKNGVRNGKVLSNVMESEEASPPIPNLRLEAKLTAEENTRMFAGKQIHPFFAVRKSGKKNLEMTEVDSNCCSIGRKDNTIGPIHVFERIQDEVVSINWGNWTFCEKTSTSGSCSLEGTISSVFESSVESLNFEKLPSDSHPGDESLLQDKVSSDRCCIKKEHVIETSPKVSVMVVDEQEACCQILTGSDTQDHQLDENRFPGNAASVRKSDVEEKFIFPQERLMSYYNGCGNQPKVSLWTDKYRPKNATEVCGNNESVKFLSDWLHLWREREFRTIKDSSGSDKCSLQDDYEIDSDSENIDEDGLKNVLLVTGPVGSGKSAAIHACAVEKRFKVLENNASDCRFGAVVKQKFGEALESHCLDRSMGNPLDLQNKNIMESTNILCNGEALQQVDDEMIKVIRTSDKENSREVLGTLGKYVCKERTVYDRAVIKPLILFEDVDIIFAEDRGFIAAIQQIAEKAKGPVILTSNSNDVILPDNLDRFEISFTMPSPKDLLSHLFMICAAEKVDIERHLLEQLIEYCDTDIRKTIMHIQFWCQNKRSGKDKIMQKVCCPLLFDADAGHQMLPKIIPWDFPSELSELVEKEISKSLSLMEENTILRELAEGEGHKQMLSRQDMHNIETDSIEAKKKAMLSLNCSVHTNNEFEDPPNTACGLSSFPGTPVSFARRDIRRKVNVVTSSDSEDDLFLDRCPPMAEKSTNKELYHEDYSSFHFSNTQNCIKPPTDKLLHSEAENIEENHNQCSEIANNSYINGTCKSVDISGVPESTIVPETEIVDGVELLSGTVCSGDVAETVEVSVGNGFDLNLAPVEADYESPVRLPEFSDMLGNICDLAEPSQGEDVEDSQNEHGEAVSRGYQVLDECSRIDFEKRSEPMEKHRCCLAVDQVKESWSKLRHSQIDLKQYVTSEKTDAFQIVKLANGMCKLISDSDLLLSKCQTLDYLEVSKFPCEESDSSSWRDEHSQMTSTIAQHGFHFAAKSVSTVGSNLAADRMKDLSWEMFSCTTNMMASGKLPKSKALSESEVKSSLFNTIKSIVPRKSYLALKGDAFHEYLSSLGCISRSETSRLSELKNKTKRRRARGARHYLSTGALMLSPEDISVLGQSNLYGKN
ncbi:uncharacterized protein LOC116139808 isoform X1 [Pistacia vera]|uniref:uncharacterized protein LOC116139808 isoform X1 n=1 Tax=Pistacia vera TaxID=55513 RepID=UPI0012631C55|nr:uncharacterized protein LOC116139808 isoform X1 [Pistacia vera]